MKQKFLVFLFIASSLFASGFQLNEFGAKAMGMGGAFTAVANTPTAIFFNPAGITQLNGTQLSIGSNIITLGSTFRGVSPDITEYKLKDQIFTPIIGQFTYKYDDNLSFGIGLGNPFGLGTKWDDNWIGRYITTEIEIRVFSLQPVIAYKLMDNLSVSAGLNYNYSDVLIRKNVNLAPFSTIDGKVKIKGDDQSFGYAFGILYKPIDNLSLGLGYRSKVKYEFTGTTSKTAPSQLSGKLPSGKTSAKLTTPVNLSVGVAYKFDNLLLSCDYQYVGWSSYDSLNIKFNESNLESKSYRGYNNSYIIRFGLDYNVNDILNLYAGIYYDKSPVKDEHLDPTLPDANRMGYSAGFGYKFNENIQLDLSYLFLRMEERKITNSEINYSGIAGAIAPFNGVYNSYAHLFSLTLNYSF
jgi:long-chain fatty acid transport protein